MWAGNPNLAVGCGQQAQYRQVNDLTLHHNLTGQSLQVMATTLTNHRAMFLNLIRMCHLFQGLAFVASLASRRLLPRLALALGAFGFAVAITGGWLAAGTAVFRKAGLQLADAPILPFNHLTLLRQQGQKHFLLLQKQRHNSLLALPKGGADVFSSEEFERLFHTARLAGFGAAGKVFLSGWGIVRLE